MFIETVKARKDGRPIATARRNLTTQGGRLISKDGIRIARIRAGANTGVRVRITEHPREPDIEGVSLDTLRPGAVCDVSASVGSWLIVQGYAYPEMRRTPEDAETAAPAPHAHLPERRQK